MPVAQAVQTVVEEAYLPSRHAVHFTVPVAGAMVPSGQFRQFEEACMPWYVPAAHSVHCGAEPREYLPSAHALQVTLPCPE